MQSSKAVATSFAALLVVFGKKSTFIRLLFGYDLTKADCSRIIHMMGSTIVAQSTPVGRGGIAVIRLSGSKSADLASLLTGKQAFEPRRAEFCHFKTDKIVDDGVVTYFRAPNSYTGEDVIEISCHGSQAIVSEIIRYLVSNGAVMAKNGEFTRRAYMNKKFDLVRAEAVIDLIDSQSIAQINNAYDQAHGRLSAVVQELQDKLTDTIAALEVAMDYPEEDLDEITRTALTQDAQHLSERIDKLIATYELGRTIRDGVKVAIVGKPNVGKSSLLNAIVGYDRAIVSDVAGTTRDVIEVTFIYKSMKFVFADTAGMRATDDAIERMGVMLSDRTARSADITLAVGSEGEECHYRPEGKYIAVNNKCDLYKSETALNVSAVTGEGIDELKERIYDMATQAVADDLVITNLRHFEELCRARDALRRAIAEMDRVTLDCIAVELTESYDALGSITGAVGSEQIIDRIFSKFCVGK